MIQVLGSYNSRFFAVRSATELRLYRGITPGGLIHSNEATLEWARQMDANSVGELILLGNHGDLFLCGPKGLFRVKNERGASLDRIAPVCVSAENPDVRVGLVRVDAEGRDVCYEVKAPDTGIKGKLFGLFKKSQGDNQAHNLFHYSLITNQQVSYPSFPVEKSKEEMFTWNISPQFRYLVVAQPEKKAYHLQIIDTLEEAVIAEFELPLTPIRGAWVNDEGTLTVDVANEGEHRIFVVRQESRKSVKESFTPPPGYRIRHISNKFIALDFPSSHRLALYNFSGQVIADVDLRPLLELGATPFFNFNDRGDIDILLWQNGQLYIQHSDSRSIITDAKRWLYTAREQQVNQEAQHVREVTEQHEEERRRLDNDYMSRHLAASMNRDDFFFDIERPAMPSAEVEYRTQVELGPVVRPPLPPPTAEPITQIAAPVRESLPPVHEPAPPVAPPPPPPPEPTRPVSPILSGNLPEPEPLSFLRGFLPPPNTEEEDDGPPPPPPPPAPVPKFEPPPPPRVEQPPVLSSPVAIPPVTLPSDLSVIDHEAELERLRMLYIAGELSREEYYRLRSQVEEAKRSQVGGAAKPAIPKRLNIELDGPTIGPKGERRIDLEKPLQIDIGGSSEP